MAPRVELRRLEPEDQDRILAWRNSPDVRALVRGRPDLAMLGGERRV